MNKILKSFLQFSGIALALLLVPVLSNAQIDASTSNGRPRKPQFPQPILETLEKKRIEDAEKEHRKMLERGELALKLSEELEKSFEEKEQLTSNDKKKLKDLEKLLKKIRSELGGDDDDKEDKEEKPASIKEAITSLRKNTVNLFDELQRTSRHTISAVAIESSNLVLKIVKFLRFGN